VRQAISQSSNPWEQSFSFGEIHGQHSQMVSDSLELRSIRSIRSEKKFLKHNRVNGEANKTSCLGRKQLRRRWITSEVSNDHVCIQENEWPLRVGALATFERLGFGHLFHFLIVLYANAAF
jgi:hypothetical protein